MRRAPRDSEAPKVYRDIIDFACDLDRTFFKRNADQISYVRAYVPGEFWPHDSHIDRMTSDLVESAELHPQLVLVMEIKPSLRSRRPLFDIRALDTLASKSSKAP
jgi:hypothetical protein